jgi:Ca2+-binding EF-hand superfamily protein
MVDRAFAILDKNGSGAIQAADIANVYDTSKNPEVIEGKKTAD